MVIMVQPIVVDKQPTKKPFFKISTGSGFTIIQGPIGNQTLEILDFQENRHSKNVHPGKLTAGTQKWRLKR